ncbi:hypothetical protein Ddye_013129 [Dipteronia dyeriana]|uniref:Uncharacterized protein n=1 Tax=Dipteronia dyeriana TaxID=168575 RepID=A0AAD9X5Z7_9ROSI|nr:hypothetical protein Ddye_013129 [Dipteronia dyeriana]
MAQVSSFKAVMVVYVLATLVANVSAQNTEMAPAPSAVTGAVFSLPVSTAAIDRDFEGRPSDTEDLELEYADGSPQMQSEGSELELGGERQRRQMRVLTISIFIQDHLDRRIQAMEDSVAALWEDIRKSNKEWDRQHKKVMDFLQDLWGLTSRSDRDSSSSHDQDSRPRNRDRGHSQDEGQTLAPDLISRVPDLRRREPRLELLDEISRHLPRVYQSFLYLWRSMRHRSRQLDRIALSP